MVGKSGKTYIFLTKPEMQAIVASDRKTDRVMAGGEGRPACGAGRRGSGGKKKSI
jgi:hypothetical protein